MQSEKVDNGNEKSSTGNGTVTPVKNEVANLKLSDGETGNSLPSSPSAPQAGTFLQSFKAFSKFGDTKSDGKHITLSQSDKWMKQAKVIDKKITTTDTGIYFKKQKSMKLSIEQYKAFLDELAKAKKVDVAEIKSKMANCGPPGVTSSSTTAGKAASTVDRLTDVSRYTGSHRQRFDESGKGKGIAGRKDVPDVSGYVQGYQNKNTYKTQ